MPIKPDQYMRKPFFVQAVQVSEENLEDVAAWCKGDIHKRQKRDGNPEVRYIRVDVRRAISDRQSQAYAGDWVLRTKTSFKVYTNGSFMECFVKTSEDTNNAVQKLGLNA